MKIKSVHISNFRSLKDCTIEFDNYTAFVGANGAGKSTVLAALNIFFRDQSGSSTNIIDLDEEDFHNKNISAPIQVTVSFCDLSPDAVNDFADYVRQGLLVVTAQADYDSQTRRAQVQQYGQRLGIRAFAPFFQAYNDGEAAGVCRTAYEQARQTSGYDLPEPSTKDKMRAILRAFEDNNADLCNLIPSKYQFYGFSKGTNRLNKYVQWVYLPAVKDATKEIVESKTTALGKILARTIRSKVNFSAEMDRLKAETFAAYGKLLDQHQGALADISLSLTSRLSHFSHPNATARLAWIEDLDTSIRIDPPTAKLFASEGAFEGELARFGTGLQRSYLLALLQELASLDDQAQPTLLLGVEEPELFQHPPQAKYLSNVLHELSAGNSQIIISSHSPYFVSGPHFECIRMVRRDHAANCSTVSQVSFLEVAERLGTVRGIKPDKPQAQMARLNQALQPQLTEMFFVPRIIFVEGLEDIAYLTSWLLLSGRLTEFTRHGTQMIPVNGKSELLEPLVVAEFLSIPTFCIFDADGDKTKPHERARHEKDNRELLTILGGDVDNLFPEQVVWNTKFVQWPSNLGQIVKSEVDPDVWRETYDAVTASLGSPKGSYVKNSIHIGMHLSLLRNEGVKMQTLESLSEAVMKFSNPAS